MIRILYVEDNEDNVYMLSQRLRKHGFEVIVAADGEQGIEMARREEPDLILMDLGLPSIDGWSAARLLKEAPVPDRQAGFMRVYQRSEWRAEPLSQGRSPGNQVKAPKQANP